MSSLHLRLGLLGLLLLPGCAFLTGGPIDADVHRLSADIDAVDRTPIVMDRLPPGTRPLPLAGPAGSGSGDGGRSLAGLQQVAYQVEASKQTQKALAILKELPGGGVEPVQLPEDPKEREAYLKKLYGPVPPLPPEPPAAPGPEGRPLTLSDLQRLGELYSPNVKAAAAAVDAAKGAVAQAGAYPNPTLFYEGDTQETGPAGYQGFGVDQVVKTGNKLKLQQASAAMDLLNARVALRRARSDLAYAVRTGYLGVLSARENVRINEALYRFAASLYQTQAELSLKGQAAHYEPLQLRPLVLQARLNVQAARNQYLASWRQLAAALGLPEMPPTEMVGRIDLLPVPDFDFDDVRRRVLDRHTDVQTAVVNIHKGRYQLALARVTPIPDVDLRLLVQKDYTAVPNQIAHTFSVSVPTPLWDRNTGAIRQAEAQLAQAAVGPEQARNNLTTTLADAFNRYLTARLTVETAQQQVRDQVLAYRGAYLRRQQLPADVAFGDLVTSQQTLAGYITAYLLALQQQWTAVNDIANLLQTEELFQPEGPSLAVEPLPDLEQLLPQCYPGGGGCKEGPPHYVELPDPPRLVMPPPCHPPTPQPPPALPAPGVPATLPAPEALERRP